ncbi:MAG TPA: TIGR03936 family radical SAM-associated protein, partial [bacterium]|nr:TIGR03936 family radical SAM-associated protein [bacterium]
MVILRIIYKKEGNGIFISTNYLGKIFERAIRRLDIPLIFSHGYSGRPKLSMGPSIAVGIMGINEVIDFHLGNSDIPCLQIKEMLNKFLPEGLGVVECRYLTTDEKSPPEIKKACYTVKISNNMMVPNIPDNWNIVSRKGNFIDIIIGLDRFKHKDLFLLFGAENIIQ